MVRQYNKAASNGEAELKAQANDNGHGDKPRKQWDFYMNTDVGKDGNRDDSKLIAAVDLRAGRSKAGNAPYAMLSGFGKELGGFSVSLTKKVDVIIERLAAAGFDEVIIDTLVKGGYLK